MKAERLQEELRQRLELAGLLPVLVDDASEILDLGDELFAEIVLTDASKEDQVRTFVRDFLEESADGRKVSYVVRPRWAIARIGHLTPALGQDGGLRAAVLVPVTLRAGSKETQVTVAVTKLAEWELDRILGPTSDLQGRLQEIAELVVEGKLRRGGRSFWDPITEDYLEVASGSAASISRLFKRTA